MKDIKQLEERIGIKFKKKDWLKQSVVHRSYLNENPQFGLPHNERLEFLGDAVLDDEERAHGCGVHEADLGEIEEDPDESGFQRAGNLSLEAFDPGIVEIAGQVEEQDVAMQFLADFHFLCSAIAAYGLLCEPTHGSHPQITTATITLLFTEEFICHSF